MARSAAAQGINTQSLQSTYEKIAEGTGAHAWHYAWTCTDMWSFKDVIFPGVNVARASSHLTFGIWMWLSITACKETLHVNHLWSWSKHWVSSQMTFQEIHVLTYTPTPPHPHTQEYIQLICAVQTRLTDGEPRLPDKLSDLWGNVVHSLFHRVTEGGRGAEEWAYGNTQHMKDQG